MKQIEIPAASWIDACSEFSHAHHGWLVTVAAIATQAMATEENDLSGTWRVLRHEVPLQRLAMEEGDMVVVIGEGNAASTERIVSPQRLFRLEERDAHRGMRIDGAEGESVIVWFRVPAMPEALDGIAPAEL